jgi:hypothetical protein
MKHLLEKKIGLGTLLKERRENPDWPQQVLVDNLQALELINVEENSGHRKSSPRRRLLRRFMVMVYLFSLIFFSVFAAFYYVSFMLPSRSQPAKTIQSQTCTAISEYMLIHAVNGDYCFSGTGLMSLYAEGVIRIETNGSIASWTYIKDGKQLREPADVDKNVYVCKHMIIEYSPPVRLTQIDIVSPSEQTNCTDHDASISGDQLK